VSKVIVPTIGRQVWFWSHANGSDQAEAATVCFVHSDRCVNLQVIDSNGIARPECSVILRQPEDERPINSFCEWMPFQVGQARALQPPAHVPEPTPTPTPALRELATHRVNPANDVITIQVLDEPGAGGACHKYRLTWPGSSGVLIDFQNGPIKEAGVNGITHEALLAILIDRLEHFQNGQFANKFNASALGHLQQAQDALLSRTRERMSRGVEGTHEK
jgi:hypothetical protein